MYIYKKNFQFKFCSFDKAIVSAIIKKKYVAFPVVKKLPVVFNGNISAKKRKIKGVIM